MVEGLWSITKYKCNELELICKDIMTHSQLFMTMKLVITGTDNLPVEINPASVIIYRQDMKTVQEEADTVLIQQVAYVRPVMR